MSTIKTPKDLKPEILELIKQGLTPKMIADKLNLNYVSTQQMCNRLGYLFRPNQGNIRYFENIDTSLKAYFLGFICADGAIVKNSLTITIHSKDKLLLEKLKEEIGCEHEIKNINTPMGFDKTRNVDHVRFVITNKDLIKDLNSYGIYPKKSMTIGNIILNINKEFKDAFIIGYFDGDGSVQLRKGGSKFSKKANKINNYVSNCLSISLRGTLEFLQGFIDHLDLEKRTLQFHKTGILSITSKKDVLRFFNCYQNLSFYLTRKHNKFLERINNDFYKD